LTGAERIKLGQARRHAVGRGEHAQWEEKWRKHDPIDVILASAYGKLAHLLPIKMARMAASPFGFYRGSVPLMAADLALLPNTKILAQICGDAHVRNLGAFEAPDGRLIFDVNDFDETVEGPWEWDVKRLAASLILAGREAGNTERGARDAVLTFMRSYREGMLLLAQMRVVDAARYRVHGQFKGRGGMDMLFKAQQTTPLNVLKKMTVVRKGRRVFKENRPVLTRVPDATARDVIRALKTYRLTLPPERQHVLDFYKPEDVAFKVVGTGSVATRDYVVLCFGNGQDDPLWLQVKEEPASSYAPYVKNPATNINQGQRVVFGQRRMQTHSDILLGWTSMEGRDYLVRQLADHKATICASDLTGKGLARYAQTCGQVLAKGHARSGDASMMAGYMGTAAKFDDAIEMFAVRYADQTAKDHAKFVAAIKAGRIKAAKSTYE
jgi:uncharacterized protein (DUF2252 family)